MRHWSRFSVVLLCLVFFLTKVSVSGADSHDPVFTPKELSRQYLESLVVVTQTGRDGDDDGVGTGFVVSEDGLIATSLHVIGEGRPIRVEFASGETFPVTAVKAWDRKLDLAVLKIDRDDLQPMPLGDSDALEQGAGVIAFGNPRGFDFSVVAGEVSVVSAKREIEAVEMIQIAIPVEPGNSGGPLVDLKGRVQGIMTMKSALVDNIGFAMPVNALKSLLDRPNPMSMEKWLKVGSLDSQRWVTRFGATWSQRAGRIRVDGVGSGFGGRSLCLSTTEPVSIPYEVGVYVRMEDESGAAGLVFGSDGDHVHYGFYPTDGQLRLTHFNGPTVFNWRIIETFDSEHYRKGEWNALKVRVEEERVLCFVNDELVLEIADDTRRQGMVGLAKFRNTRAEFRGFQVGPVLPPMAPTKDTMEVIARMISDLPESGAPSSRVVRQLEPFAEDAQLILARKANRLEKQAEQLRKLAHAVHVSSVVTLLEDTFDDDADRHRLFDAAVLVSKLDNHEVDLEAMKRVMDDMVHEVRKRFGKDDSDWDKVVTLRDYLFDEAGFHGSRHDYENPANSYIDRVLEDREGLPITLSILFIEMAERLDIRRVVGVPLPGHFVVRFLPDEGTHPVEFIDVFDGGRTITLQEAAGIVEEGTGLELRDEHLIPASDHQIILRLLMNLASHRFREEAPENTLPYLEAMVALNPDAPLERWSRGMMRYRIGNNDGAKEDFKWLLEKRPRGVDLERVSQLYHGLLEE